VNASTVADSGTNSSGAGLPGAAPSALSPAELSPAEQALRTKVARLEAGRAFLESVPDYTCQFSKQELVAGELLEEQLMWMKIRHAPFSVYMKWLTGDEGREVLYVDGRYEGKMVVHGGGWKAKLPAMTIDPEGSLAMGESRYPVSKVGLLELIRLMLSFHAHDLSSRNFTDCQQLPAEEFDGRLCDSFVIEYRDAASSPNYRKSLVLLDQEWGVPLYTCNYGWPDEHCTLTGEELDEATLVECYTYSQVQFRSELADADFERSNQEYRFR
jgi:hypothetical protein